MHAGALWQRYVDFARGWPASNAAERSERVAKLRAVLQLACTLPLHAGLDLWAQYDRLEKHEVAGNEQLGAQLVDKHRPDARAAQEAAKSRAAAWDGGGAFGPPGSPPATHALKDRLAKLPVPPCCAHATASDAAADADADAADAGASGHGGWAPLLDPAALGLDVSAAAPAAAGHGGGRLWQRAGGEQLKHLAAWRCRLAHEQLNKERLPPAVARRRVVHSYEQMVNAHTRTQAHRHTGTQAQRRHTHARHTPKGALACRCLCSHRTRFFH